MKIEFEEFENRIEKIRQDTKKYCEWQSQAQKYLDFVITRHFWLDRFPDSSLQIDVYSASIYFKFEEVPVDSFITNILGPFHRKFNILWDFTINGSEDNPVFEFRDKQKYDWNTKIYFKVKEGKFTQCQVIKRVKKIHPVEVNPESHIEYEMVLDCN